MAICYNLKLQGKYLDNPVYRTNIPQVLKAREIAAAVVESSWSDDFLIETAKFHFIGYVWADVPG